MGKKKELINTQEMIERLTAKYCSPQYGILTQVRSSTGYNQVRTADAIAMSLWPSRGLNLIGFEVKASRTDWLKELKEPAKAEELGMHCHYWYIVINDADHIKEGELPEAWGLIVPYGKGLKIIKEAKYNEKAVPPDFNFTAGIFRNVADYTVPKEALKSRDNENYERGKRRGEESAKYAVRDLAELTQCVMDFEKESGIKIGKYQPNKEMGKAMKMVLDGKHLNAEKMIKKLRERAVNVVKWLDDEAKEWEV